MSKEPKSDQRRALREQAYERQQQRRREQSAQPTEPPVIPKAAIDEFEAGPPVKVGVPPKQPKARVRGKKVPLDKAAIVKQLEEKVDQVKRGRPKTKTAEERREYRRDWARKKRAAGKQGAVE